VVPPHAQAVQAQPTGDGAAAAPQSMPCAGKIGDGGRMEKAQVSHGARVSHVALS